MTKFSTKLSNRAVLSAVAGAVVAGAGLSTALVHSAAEGSAPAAQHAGVVGDSDRSAGDDAKVLGLHEKNAEKKSLLPAGVSTGTSFWDPATASGKPMSYHTLASPYWPLGTVVRVTYGKKSAVGVVEDFGPAEWAVAQHDPPAIVDLSEEMMQTLTGVRSNSVPVKFQVLRYGNGPVYRHGGTGFDMATGVSSK